MSGSVETRREKDTVRGMRDGSRQAACRRGLAVRLNLAITATVLVGAAIYLVGSWMSTNAALESKVLAEAQTLAIEMQAVWDYIDVSQTAINYNADGSYDFKGIYCAVAGKGIARRFTRDAEGYVIRYVRENPRTATDEPDEFESRALSDFGENGPGEYYALATYEGEPVFRYVSALVIERNCLDCHGSPAGEKDETGFLKEGMQQGDLAGAVSIVIPVSSYRTEALTNLVCSVVFFLLLAAVIVTLVYLVLKRWVAEPLSQENRQLATESREKSDLLATMSHELRTPLASIMAFTDIWEKAGYPKRPEEEKLVREIKDNSSALLGMVNDTIDVARIEEGRYELQYGDVDLCDVVNAAFSVAEPLAIKRGVELSKSIDMSIPIFRSDWEALRKIVLNLLSNAIKFTDSGGAVRVEARLDECGEDGLSALRIKVSDTGCGIAKEELDRIFDKYVQAGSTAGGVASSGLGLFLVRSLVERLGGTVSVQSEVGEGSTFIVLLPIDEPGEGGDSEEGEAGDGKDTGR